MSARRLFSLISGDQPHIAPTGDLRPSFWMGGFNTPAYQAGLSVFGLLDAEARSGAQSHERDTGP